MYKSFFGLALAIGISGVAFGADSYSANTVLVKYKVGSVNSLTKMSVRGTTLLTIPEIRVEKIRLNGLTPQQAIAIFKQDPNVEYAELDHLKKFFYTPNDPRLPEQYGHDRVKSRQAWDLSKGSSSTIISVIDSGLNLTHEEFVGRIAPGGFDHSDNDNDPTDTGGHGTHCAGIAVAATDNGKGVASVCFNGRILPMKIFPNSFDSTSAAAIVDAANKGARVISMSYGSSSPSQTEQDAINFAWGKNVVLFAAAGNDGNTVRHYPAALNNIIAVAATDSSDSRAGFSTYGDWVHIAAPGDNILSTYIGGNDVYVPNSGTSMACPFAASVAGLMIGRNPNVTNARVRDIIFQTCDNVGNFIQKGRINAFKAVQQVEQPVPFSGVTISAKVASISGMVEGTQVGTYASPAVAGNQLTNADGLLYSVNSIKRTQIGSVASVETESKTSVPLSNILEAKVSFKARAVAGVSCLIYAYNRATNAWDNVASKGLTDADQAVAFNMNINTLGQYLSSGGNIRFMVRSVAPFRAGSAPNFTLRMDQLNFTGQRKATP